MSKTIILKDNGEIDAMKVIKANGFIDTAPDISLCTAKIFEKDGQHYKFNGWYKWNESRRLWQDVEMVKIK